MPGPVTALVLGSSLVVSAGGPQGQPPVVGPSADSILAIARDLTGETAVGPPSRFGPRPSTAIYTSYLRTRLEEYITPLGGSVVLVPFASGVPSVEGEAVRDPYTNVVATIPGALGAASPGFFLLGAHLDATGINTPDWDPWTDPAPGADDNGSGVAALIEVTRVMAARGMRPQANLVIAFFDGEEIQDPGTRDHFLLGSTFMAEGEDLGRLYGMLNLDMVAYNPRVDSLVAITNIPSRWLGESLRRVATDPRFPSPGLIFEPLVSGVLNSDHAPFWLEGYDAIMLSEAADVGKHQPNYHRVTDTVDQSYSRGGAMVQRAAELVLGQLETWSGTGPAALEIEDGDLLIQRGAAVDVPVASVGQTVEILAGVTNRGGTLDAPWSVRVILEQDGRVLDSLAPLSGERPLPAGAHQKLRFPWTVPPGAAGSVLVRAEIESPGNTGTSRVAERQLSVEGPEASVVRGFVYPNPTRLSMQDRAVLVYELTRQGPVRLTLLDATGARIAETDLRYDPRFPADGVDVGQAKVTLGEVFPVTDLAPGLYLVRVELFGESGTGTEDVAVVKWAVLR